MSNQKSQLHYYEDPNNDYESKKGALKRAPNRAFKRKSSIIMKESKSGGGGHYSRVLEIGAGSGLLSYFTTQMLSFDEYIVSDLSENMLGRARNLIRPQDSNQGKIKFEIIDLYQIYNVKQKYDLIIGTDIIHHLEVPEDVLRNLKTIMNPGGKLVILETNIQNPLAWINVIGREHEMRAVLNTRENLLKWLIVAGWSNASVAPAPSFTPAGPRPLHPFLNLVDWLAVRTPRINQVAALWKLTADS